MEEQDKKNDDTPKKGDIPPSRLTITFAGPGSAQIIDIATEGIVTTEQRGAMGLFFISTAMQDWAIPLLQQIVTKTIEGTVPEIVKELMKPKIEAATRIPPDMLRGGGPS